MDTFLCVDIGNTRLKWAMANLSASDPDWLATGSMYTSQASLAAILATLPSQPRAVVACCVTHRDIQLKLEAQASKNGLQWITISSATHECGVSNTYPQPWQLGSDRWASLIAAGARHDGDCLVVSSGTATTVDTLTAEGRFIGGWILPGVSLMQTSLMRATANLERLVGHSPENRPLLSEYPRNTADAIKSGALAATLCVVKDRYQHLNKRPLCILTGGDAGTLAAHLPFPHQVVEHLVLEGLFAIYLARRS